MSLTASSLKLPEFVDANGLPIPTEVFISKERMEGVILPRIGDEIARFLYKHQSQKCLLVSTKEGADYSFNWILDKYFDERRYSLTNAERTYIWPRGGGTLGEERVTLKEDCPIDWAGRVVLNFEFLCHHGFTVEYINNIKNKNVSPSQRPAELKFIYVLEKFGEDVARGKPPCYGNVAETIQTPLYLAGCGLDWKDSKSDQPRLRNLPCVIAVPRDSIYTGNLDGFYQETA